LRRRTLARNAAWIAWLRLPWSEASRATMHALATFSREGTLALDGVPLLRGLAWALRRRKLVPPQVLSLRERVRTGERQLAAPAPATARAKPTVTKVDART
jgi:hypothetical protein